MVFARPPAGRETELQEWYDIIHGPDAIENGSFHSLSRWQCVSNPGAPFLALWEGEWESDEHAWDYIRPLARQLHAAGRIGDIPSADWAQMTFTHRPLNAIAEGPVRTLTMVQSDWYHPDRDVTIDEWAARHGLTDPALGGGTWHARYLYEADRAVEPGLFAALYESRDFTGTIAAGWAGVGARGPSPTRAFKGLFEERGGDGPVPEPTPLYLSHWVQVGALGRHR